MRRALLICLMLILPLQWSWAAAAAASMCGHEVISQIGGPVHFGHHEHEHGDASHAKKSAKPAAKSAAAADAQPDLADADCAHCHGPAVSALMGSLPLTPKALGRDVSVQADVRWVQRAPDNPLRPPQISLA